MHPSWDTSGESYQSVFDVVWLALTDKDENKDKKRKQKRPEDQDKEKR